MAKKNFNVDYSNPPETLENHIFYGLQLDEQQKNLEMLYGVQINS